VVARYGGTVDKFIGDAVVAVWGTPTAHEDDAERAVRAGFDLSEAVATLGKELNSKQLALRAAVGSGQAAVVVGAVGQGMVAGDLVNTASRLQAAALPGGLLVDERTYHASNSAILFEPAGEQTLKGKALPVPAWRALRVVAARRGAGRTERLEPPFVGREEEIRLLKDLFHATTREKRARLVSIVGQAGIGKSRLAWEFQKYIDGLVQDIYWHQGRSPSYGEGITFWALGEMVRRRAGIAETDDVATTRQRLTATLADYVPDEDERRWLEPMLGALLGIDEAPTGQREQLFAAWRTFFERVSDRGPTVMVFQDLQWADQGLLDFIEHLLQWSRPHPILIVTLSRPELRDRRPTWGVDQRNFAALHLESLSDDSVAQLLNGLVPGLPDAVLGQIVKRAEGVPLYAVETVRMLLDEGKLQEQDGTYRTAGDVSRLAVPATLHALINARLDGLPPEERSLLQDAAVLGQSFALPGLVSLRAEPAERVEPQLRSLVHKELLAYDADPRSPERGQYQFVQGLIREIAYENLPKRQRQQRHLEVARYLERLGEPELAGAVASHYLEAYQASPEGLEAQSLKARARESLKTAAQRAAGLYSHGQALSYLEQALAVTDDESEQLQLWELAAYSAEWSAQLEVAESYLRQALARPRQEGDRADSVRLTAKLGWIMNLRGRPEEAIATLRAAQSELEGLAPDPAGAELSAELARAYMLHGENEQAVEWAEKALAAAGPLNLVPVIVEALITRGPALLQRRHEGLAQLMGALALAEAHGLTRSEIRARNNICVLQQVDDKRAQLGVALAGLDKARRLGLLGGAVAMATNSAEAAFHTGDWELSLNLVTEFDREDIPLERRLELVLLNAVIQAWRGDPLKEAKRIAAIETLAGGWTNPDWKGSLPWYRTEIALAAGDPEEAYRQALLGFELAGEREIRAALFCSRAARAMLWVPDRGRAADAVRQLDALPVRGAWLDATRKTFHAGLLALEGRREEAVAAYTEALKRWRELELAFDLGLCAFEFATLVGPEYPDARAAAAEAKEIFTRLKATPMLKRLERLTLSPVAGEG
jgi:hypothetical protein